MQNKGYIWGAALAVLIIIAGVFIFRAHKASAPSPIASSTSTMGTTTVDLGNGETAILPPGVTLTEIDVPVTGTQAPNLDTLNRSIVYSADLPPDAVLTLKADIASTTASIKANPSQSDKWLALGVYYKMAGDYTAAQSVWIYLTKAIPTSYIPFFDLGDLYQSFIVNYPKAETNYLQAVKLKPDLIDAYVDLFYLYRGFYKTNTTAAADIIAAGLKANPNNSDLLELQKQLQTKS